MNCRELVDNYVEWLGNRMAVEDIDGICEITTPFLDRHNDRIQIYIKDVDSKLTLTDDGYTIADLEMAGCDLNTEKRQRLLRTALNGFGVQLEGDELCITATPSNFPQKKHNLLQAILSIGDLFVLAQPTVANIFREDVEKFLLLNDVPFTPDISLAGRSGFVHFFDFVIPAWHEKPERIIRTINRPSRDNVSSLLFAWEDTQDARPPKSRAYALLNDETRPVSSEHRAALERYGIVVVAWSEREKYRPQLAA